MRHAAGVLVAVAVGIAGAVPSARAMEAVADIGRPDAWVIESAEYTGEVRDQIARLEGRYVIRVLRDGWVQIPLSLSNATVTAIDMTHKSGEAHIIPSGGVYMLAASRKGTYKIQVKFSSLLTQDSQFEGVQLGIPQATFSTMALSVARRDVELREADQLYVERQPDPGRDGVRLIAHLGAAPRIDLRWRIRPAAPVAIEPVLYGEVSTLVTLEEQLARIMSVIEYRIAQGETKELRLTIPQALNVLNVRGAGIEDWRVAETQGRKVLTVSLGMTLKETTYRLILEGEQLVPEGSAAYALPEITLSGVKQERGSIGIARSGSIEVSPSTVEGANRVDVRELSPLLQAGAGSPAVVAFRYHQHPYRLTVSVTRHEDHPVLSAIAERGELVTVVSRQGELLTRATYLIQANKKQFLTVSLPREASLWSCIVDGKSVKPVKGTDEALLIPLTTTAESATSVTVELVYFERRAQLARIGRLRLEGPTLDVPITVAHWAVFSPREVKFLRVSGNLERGHSPIEFLDDPFQPGVQLAAIGGGWSSELADRKRGMEQGQADASVSESDTTAEGGRDDEREEGAHRRNLRLLTSVQEKVDRLVGSKRRAANEAPQGAVVAGKPTQSELEVFASRAQESGILPLKIRLPKAGRVYRFSRLMTTQEALTLDATFVHLPAPWLPFAGVGLLLLPMGGMVARRIRRV